MNKTVTYVMNRRDYSRKIYLEGGHCSFTNNFSENTICPFVVGRKNWQPGINNSSLSKSTRNL